MLCTPVSGARKAQLGRHSPFPRRERERCNYALRPRLGGAEGAGWAATARSQDGNGSVAVLILPQC